jgi:DNA-binding transcriptional LysR family regulator
MDRLSSMLVFTKTVELGSFAATAKLMQLSPQMVAKHIAYLEYHLGSTLIHRTTRKQVITTIGHHYYQQCKQILNDIEEAESTAKQLQLKPKGLLKISAPVTFGTTSVSMFTQKFLQEYPEIRIELQLSDQYVSALDEGFDVLIRIGDVHDTTLVATPLRPYRLIVCAAPHYLQKNGNPNTPTALALHNCLIYGTLLQQNSCQWCFSKQQEVIQARVQGNLICNHWQAMYQAAISGLGIILGPADALAPAIQAGQLQQILCDYQAPLRPMQILYPAKRKPTAKILCFVKAFEAEFGPDCP